jgi:hypothetical protein
MPPEPDPLDTDLVLMNLNEVAKNAGYRVEWGTNELPDSSVHAGVCVFSKRLIQLNTGLRKLPAMAQFVLIHELAHGLLHDVYMESDNGAIRAKHEAEANTVRKLVWPHLNGYPFDFETTLDVPNPAVVAAANRILAQFGISASGVQSTV